MRTLHFHTVAFVQGLFANRFVQRAAHKLLFAGLMVLCLLWSAAQALSSPAPAALRTGNASVEWPREWDGAPLRPLALGEVEQRFAERFPGAMARLTDGQRTLVLRHVVQPTRMLHPAADCYRALGYRLADERLIDDAQARRWRCFSAHRDNAAPLSVCERIEDAHGQAFTDTSAWYWAAVAGHSEGPWRAVTVAGPL